MEAWVGVSYCFGAAALYLIGKSIEDDAEVLKSVTRVNQLKGLAQLLDTASKVLPTVVAISGRVGSESPINCRYSSSRGVIVEETARQHFLKQNDKGEWKRDSELMLSTCKEVPWYLDDGTARVFVVGARGASGLVLQVGSEVFEGSASKAIVCGKKDCHHGLQMIGLKRVERILPTGTRLTVVGEAVKDKTGTLHIQRPHNGPFYVSDKTIDYHIGNLGAWASFWKFASAGLAIFGAYLIARHAFEYIMERKQQWEMRRRDRAAAAERAGPEGTDINIQLENGQDRSRNDQLMPECVICLVQEYNSVFVPCGHMCCCMGCSSRLTNCPLCRRRINSVVRTFRN